MRAPDVHFSPGAQEERDSGNGRRVSMSREAAILQGVTMSRREIAKRLREADRVRAVLRRCSREWRVLGQWVLEQRTSGSDRPDDGSPSCG